MTSLLIAAGLLLTIWLLALGTVIFLLAIVNKFLYASEDGKVEETLYFSPEELD